MVICFQLSSRIKDQLERLVSIGQYRDESEAVSVAISNQILLHADVGSERSQSAQPMISRQQEEYASNQAVPEALSDDAIKRVPPVFSAITAGVTGIKIAPLPNDTFSMDQDVPVDQWIFGQYNKLLPVKATCRALANLLLRDLTSYEGVPLSKAASEIAGEAVMLGDFLRQADQRSRVHRDDTLAFAFPRSDSTNSDKSRLRFASQFVASLSNQGLLSGLPVELKLVNKDASRPPRLLLTEAGWQFAKLANPVLDVGAELITKKFTDDETNFLIQHILMHVPAENFAFRAVLGAIARGAITPNKLDDALELYLPQRHAKPFTRAFLTTQRAGVISRLSDLGLVQRIRDGIRVTYSVTAKARQFSSFFLDRMA